MESDVRHGNVKLASFSLNIYLFSLVYLVDEEQRVSSVERVHVGDALHGLWHADDSLHTRMVRSKKLSTLRCK